MTVSRVKVKLPTKFPSSVTVESPLSLDRTGGAFVFSIDDVPTQSSDATGGQVAWFAANGKTISGSSVVSIDPGPIVVSGRDFNLNYHPLNAFNGVTLGYGTASGNNEGGSQTFWTKLITGNGAPGVNTEIGFTQAVVWNGTAFPVAAPVATVYITTEQQTLTNNGQAVLFQAITRGEVSARGEVSIAEGLKALGAGAVGPFVGMGLGTLDSANGTYDTGKRVLSASNPSMTINQNAATLLGLSNTSVGTSALAAYTAGNSLGSLSVGIGGSGFTGFSSLLQNKVFMLSSAATAGLVLYADGASNPIDMITNGTLRARVLLGLGVGTTSDPGAGMIYTNAAAFMIRTKTSYANGAAAAAGTILNAPAAGNPTKWIPVDDNGTTRYIPAW